MHMYRAHGGAITSDGKLLIWGKTHDIHSVLELNRYSKRMPKLTTSVMEIMTRYYTMMCYIFE